MQKRLNKFLEQENCFFSLQFGFRELFHEQCTDVNYREYSDSVR